MALQLGQVTKWLPEFLPTSTLTLLPDNSVSGA